MPFFFSISASSMASRPPAVGRRRAALVGYFLAPPDGLPALLHPAMASAGDVAVAGAFSRLTPKRRTKLYLDDDSFPRTHAHHGGARLGAAPAHIVRLDTTRHYRCA